jgi:hypothetical protein
MCDYCRKTVGTLALPHESSACPLKISLWCACCNEKGHSTRSCVLQNENEIYAPPSLHAEGRRYKAVLDVVNTPSCIRAILAAHEIQPSGRPKQNLVLLEQLAAALDSRLVLHKFPVPK